MDRVQLVCLIYECLLCVLGYVGFFRFNELVQFRRCDFQFEDSFLRIFVHRSKTNIYRDGA